MEQTPHPVHDTGKGKFNTVTGGIIDIHNPEPAMFNLIDIASGLSKICRFGGQCKHFYSVAQHCVIVAALSPVGYKLEGLMHDATEAYLGDVIKPLKLILGETYVNIEKRFETAIIKAFNLNKTYLESIKPYDMMALEVEAEYLLFDNTQQWQFNMQSLGLGTELWAPDKAKAEFIKAFGNYRR